MVVAANRVLVFELGYLCIKSDGRGYFCVPDADMIFEDDRGEGPDGPEGSIHWVARMDTSEIAALRDFLNNAAPSTPSWSSIETAPKDGTDILLHGLLYQPSIDAGTPKTVIGYWTDYNGGGWVWHGALAITFTHWHPLPALPSGDDF